MSHGNPRAVWPGGYCSYEPDFGVPCIVRNCADSNGGWCREIAMSAVDKLSCAPETEGKDPEDFSDWEDMMEKSADI